MKLNTVINLCDYKITDGADYQWQCYGPNARMIDFESTYAYVSATFDSVNQTVYEVTVHQKPEFESADAMQVYRWLNPDTKEAMIAESKRRGVAHDQAWDDIKWYDLEVEDDWTEKATAIFHNMPFDRRVQVTLDLTEAEWLSLARLAHERDITLNKMVEVLLTLAIELRK